MAHNLSHITAAILAGGQGTRLRNVIGDQPKVLANVCGRPFIAYLLDQLETAGLQNIVLCLGYKGEEIKRALGDKYHTLKLNYSQETKPLDTAGALRLALPILQSDNVLVMNGDSYCAIDLNQFWLEHLSRNAMATILLINVGETSRYGQVEVDAHSRVTNFTEKGKQTRPGWINAGIYIINRGLLATIPPDRAVSLEKEMFPNWLAQPIYGYFGHAKFIDIGTPASYVLAQNFFASLKLTAEPLNV